MTEDYEYDEEMGDEENLVESPVCPPNLYDYLVALMHIPMGLVGGIQVTLQRITMLWLLQRDATDEIRERKKVARDFEQALSRF